MNKQQNQAYTDEAVLWSAERELDYLARALNGYFKALKARGEDNLSEARSYQLKGSDFKRKEIINECEKYIAKTAMPSYLQNDARQRAGEQIPLEYVNELDNYLPTLEVLPLTKDNIYFDKEKSKWCVADGYKLKVLAQADKTLNDDEQLIFEKMKAVFNTLAEVNQTHQALNIMKYFGCEDSELAYRIAGSRNNLTLEQAKRMFPERFTEEC